MANWKDREMCEPFLNENEDENPFASGGSFWEVTFRTAWTEESGESDTGGGSGNDSFEARRALAGENAVGFLLDYFFKAAGPFALDPATGETQYDGPTYVATNCRELHEVFNPPSADEIGAMGYAEPIYLPASAKEAYYIPGMADNDSDVGHYLEGGDQGKLLFHVLVSKHYIDSFAMVEEQLQDMKGETPFAIVLKLQKLQEDIDNLTDNIFQHYTQKMKEAESDGFEFNFDLPGLGKEMKKFPKAISDYMRKVSPYVCDWDSFENGIDTTYDDRLEIGFNPDLTVSYIAAAEDPKRNTETNASAEPGETPTAPKKYIAVPSRTGVRCLSQTVPFDNARLVNLLMRMYSMTDEEPGT